jgi:hypothetical protein
LPNGSLFHSGVIGRTHIDLVHFELIAILFSESLGGFARRRKLGIGVQRVPIFGGFVAAGLGHKINECVFPRGILVGYPVTDNLETVLGL